MSEGAALQLVPVIVHTWPVRSDAVVVSAVDGTEIARFDPTDPPASASAAHRLRARSDERIAAALTACEADQDMLRLLAGPGHGWIGLHADPAPSDDLAMVLAEHGLACDQVEYAALPDLIAEIDTWPLERLWPLLADWWDRAVLRYPAGFTRTSADSPLTAAAPDVARLCREHGGVDYLRMLIDAPVGPFGLHHVLLWRYLARSEFPGQRISPPAVLAHTPPHA